MNKVVLSADPQEGATLDFSDGSQLVFSHNEGTYFKGVDEQVTSIYHTHGRFIAVHEHSEGLVVLVGANVRNQPPAHLYLTLDADRLWVGATGKYVSLPYQNSGVEVVYA